MRLIRLLANTPWMLAGTVVWSWFLAAGLFSILEKVAMTDSMYWSITTLSTTGYGDISPATGPGKVLAGVYMAWSLFFLLPAAIFHIAEGLLEDKDEVTDSDLDRVERKVNLLLGEVGYPIDDRSSQERQQERLKELGYP